MNTSQGMNSVLGTSRNDMLGRTYIVDKDQSKYLNMTVELLQCLDQKQAVGAGGSYDGFNKFQEV